MYRSHASISFPVQLPLIPIIPIDSDEARNVEVTLTFMQDILPTIWISEDCQKLYETSQNAGYDFTLDEVQDWLERQAVTSSPQTSSPDLSSYRVQSLEGECEKLMDFPWCKDSEGQV
ncbi:unnamed protein product [Rhizophagus irregularis]|nr:unnamed protein product [Rhizophagus irregularis]